MKTYTIRKLKTDDEQQNSMMGRIKLNKFLRIKITKYRMKDFKQVCIIQQTSFLIMGAGNFSSEIHNEPSKQLTQREAKYLQQIFGEPCYSKNQQSVRLINMIGGNTKKTQLPNENESYLVMENTNAEQLLNKWYNKYIKNTQNKKGRHQFLLMYEKESKKFPLYNFETIFDLKWKLDSQIFIEGLTLFVYETYNCPYQQQQCSMNEQNLNKFESQHQQFIEIPIKVLIDQKRAYYFYIQKASTLINIKELNESILKELKYSDSFQFEKDIKYTLWVEKESISPLMQQKLDALEIPQQKMEKILQSGKLILDNQLLNLKVRQFVSPGEIITLCFTTPCFKYQFASSAKDCQIRIRCFEKNIQSNKDDLIKSSERKPFLEKKTIEKNFSEISKMKISTLLKQESVEDPLVMSLYLDGEIIRPSARFQEIQKLQLYIDKNEPVTFFCIPDNILYFQQLSELLDKNTMQDLLKEIPNKKKLRLTIYEQSKHEFKRQKMSRLERLKQTKGLRQEHKDPNFLDPIMIYTTDMICYKLNSFLRETSPALFTKEQIRNEYWPYAASQKIISNLLKLDNYFGTVYRGAGSFQYDCKKGEVIEWCCFTSTSIDINAALDFIKFKSYPYVFEIETFTGKNIGKFSIVQTEHQVLLLPYTKFKILDVQQNQNYTYVKMLQIPVPKKIPGNIVVWIDNNFKQNSLYFSMLVKDFELNNFDLIQLKSNQHFLVWLNEFRYLLDFPPLKIHFITNMNRSPKVQGKIPEGIQTLNIVRSFNKTVKVIFFITGVQQKWEDLKKAGKDQDANILVIEDHGLLNEYLLKNSLKQNKSKE